MPLSNIDHYAIRTHQLEATKSFYEILGLTVGPRPNFNFDGYWLYLGDVALVHLIAVNKDNPTGLSDYLGDKKATNQIEGSGNVDHLAFRATDANALKHTLSENNIAFREREVPNLGLFQIFAEDPNNITIEINYYKD